MPPQVPHPICETGCGRCLPGVQRTRFPHRDRILGPAWHRRRTQDDLERNAFDPPDDELSFVFGAEEEQVPLMLYMYGGLCVAVSAMVCRYSCKQRRRLQALQRL